MSEIAPLKDLVLESKARVAARLLKDLGVGAAGGVLSNAGIQAGREILSRLRGKEKTAWKKALLRGSKTAALVGAGLGATRRPIASHLRRQGYLPEPGKPGADAMEKALLHLLGESTIQLKVHTRTTDGGSAHRENAEKHRKKDLRRRVDPDGITGGAMGLELIRKPWVPRDWS